jgi:crotonobetainyl-CoA:carnitine CoA-transferase CaiB-like acyl-CoA transferase
MTSGPCAGIKVLDLSTVVSGPMCGRLLGDLGADVVKLESTEGDMLRAFPPLYRGMSGYFMQMNRNKRGIAIDLKTDQGRTLARELATKADVFIENFRPGVAARLGLDYESLRDGNPGLIYAAINGVGDAGPYADQPTYDQVIQGLVGFMPVQGADGPPLPIRNPIVDKVTAMSAAMAILAALNHRHTSGCGQRINTRMLDTWAAFILPERMHNYTFQSADAPEAVVRDVYRVFETRDGHVIGLVLQDNQFRGICTALDRHDIADDSRFATPAARTSNFGALHIELRADIARLSTQEFLALARRHQVPFAPVNDIDAFFSDPQVRHNGAFFEADDPEFGTLRHLGFMSAFGATPSTLQRRAPRLGEHTDEVLGELGYSAEAIDGFRSAGLVR